jgi:hypothetical protein
MKRAPKKPKAACPCCGSAVEGDLAKYDDAKWQGALLNILIIRYQIPEAVMPRTDEMMRLCAKDLFASMIESPGYVHKTGVKG